MYPLGQGFVLAPDDVAPAIGSDVGAAQVVKPFAIARDLTQTDRRCQVIDLWPLSEDAARNLYPSLYQWVLMRVKPERSQNPVEERRRNWWLFTRPIPALRAAAKQLPRLIFAPRTAKHLSFQFVEPRTVPDTSVVAIASDSPYLLGVVSSRLHCVWALATGGTLEDRPRYQHRLTFNAFAFPATAAPAAERIGTAAERIDAHRKRVQSQYPDLTLTALYNVLEKLRRNEPLTAKDKVIHDHGLVSVLRELHDDLDRAVFAAYGWSDLADALVGMPGATTPYPEKSPEQAAAEEELLSRLVTLNAERAAEEARGVVRWLRPEFQVKAAQVGQTEDSKQRGGQRGAQGEIDVETEPETDVETEALAAAGTAAPLAPAGKRVAWPSTLPEQIRLVADTVAAAPQGLDLDQLAAQFTGRGAWKKRLPDIVDSLAALGRVRTERSGDRVVLHG
jgi:hypothetical protein